MTLNKFFLFFDLFLNKDFSFLLNHLISNWNNIEYETIKENIPTTQPAATSPKKC